MYLFIHIHFKYTIGLESPKRATRDLSKRHFLCQSQHTCSLLRHLSTYTQAHTQSHTVDNGTFTTFSTVESCCEGPGFEARLAGVHSNPHLTLVDSCVCCPQVSRGCGLTPPVQYVSVSVCPLAWVVRVVGGVGGRRVIPTCERVRPLRLTDLKPIKDRVLEPAQ